MDELIRCLPDWINKWGPLLLILLAVLYGLYRLALKIISSTQKMLTGVGKDVIIALDKPTAALTTQANSMDRLTGSIQEYVARDRSEHREMIILLKVNAERLNNVAERIEEMKDDRDKKRAVS